VVMGFLGNAFVFSSICSVAKNAEWLFKKDFTPCSTCVAVLVRCSGLHAGKLARAARVRSQTYARAYIPRRLYEMQLRCEVTPSTLSMQSFL
jgi:hypothetical protein